jgi:hypothetical protein
MGVHGNDSTSQALWNDLYEAHADVVLNGHDHEYERFAPQTRARSLTRTASRSSWSAQGATGCTRSGVRSRIRWSDTMGTTV